MCSFLCLAQQSDRRLGSSRQLGGTAGKGEISAAQRHMYTGRHHSRKSDRRWSCLKDKLVVCGERETVASRTVCHSSDRWQRQQVHS